ncbi:pyridoxamine 5'-phosphate oxidase family protein [uncultured Tateyamaria sp.]|uniref:HugZ family pyridoxamine 5'-phosphate oxidase n=1 Tax=uncultured Tateyamaria sp. TaxID=455651 RepID=UPI00261E084D|nr:pyridoxamine 5'-phosphate oxidase family protein [uncultured Tateyamaria sp.]
MTDPFRTPDDDARATARQLVDDATFAALAVTDPQTGHPSVTRIALATDTDGTPVSLISDLSTHTAALVNQPACALLVGEPADKGDPLTHPRLTLHCTARFIPHAQDAQLRAHYLAARPKATLYAGFTDFRFVRFTVDTGLLNGGFGKAFKLGPGDL